MENISSALDQIMSNPDYSKDQRFENILKLGLEFLKLDLGIISHIEDNRYTVMHFYPPDGGLEKGQVFEFSKTYCDITVRFRQTISIAHMQSSQFNAHPCYKMFQLETYIGTPIYIDGKLYGTLNFTAPMPYALKFNEDHKTFMENATQNIVGLLEQPEA